jgi:ferredoxin
MKREMPPGRIDARLEGYEACIGCGVCQLSCPVWRQTLDVGLTFSGRAMALKGGARPEELGESLAACVLCGACGAACPTGIDTLGMTISLRAIIAHKGASPLAERMRGEGPPPPSDAPPPHGGKALFLPGEAMRNDGRLFHLTTRLLESTGTVVGGNGDGSRFASALEAGLDPAPDLTARFLKSVKGAAELIVTEGLLKHHLRAALPGLRVTGLGEALLRVPAVREGLRPTDLFVIEPRGFHADFGRLVMVYDRLRQETGCMTSMDTLRLATPTGAACLQGRLGMGRVDPEGQVRLMLEGRSPKRIVVECPEDLAPFRQASGIEVIHLCELAPGQEAGE